MARILTDRPSSGKSVLLFIPVASNSGFVSTAYTTLIEAPDFSVPDEGDPGSVVDPGDSSRVLAPGEVAFRAPWLSPTRHPPPAGCSCRCCWRAGTRSR
jgi:hypothetical protein